jgi:hypothetical protein
MHDDEYERPCQHDRAEPWPHVDSLTDRCPDCGLIWDGRKWIDEVADDERRHAQD